MSQIVFLLEERTMEEFLKIIIPQILPEGFEPVYLNLQSKNQLEEAAERTLKNYAVPGARFVILEDQHNRNCVNLKKLLVDKSEAAGRKDNTLVRIVCCELESWLPGDMDAVAEAVGKDSIKSSRRKSKYRNPDHLINASEELEKITGRCKSVMLTTSIALKMDCSRNHSKSFQVFLSGIEKLTRS